MEQPLKHRLIGAVILISLAVIFVPMLIGQKPTDTDIITIEIPEAPKDIEPNTPTLAEQEDEVLATVSISKESGVKITELSKPTIPEPPQTKTVEGISAWVVQVGSFSDSKNANALASKLKAAGFTAFVEQSSIKSGDIFRVRVGPELSKEKAEVINTKLQKEQSLPKAIVVQYP